MDAAHHGANEALDMGAESGSRDRPMDQLHTVFGAAAGEGFTVEFRAIVDMNGPRDTEHDPGGFGCGR